MAVKVVRRYDKEGKIIEDKDLPNFKLDSPVVRQILFQMNQEIGSKMNIKLNATREEISNSIY